MALPLALFMVLLLSIVGASLMFVSRAETVSSHNYRLMTQARYGAEAGVHAAANFLVSPAYQALAPGSASDSLANYNTTVSPVTVASTGAPVTLSTSGTTTSTYPLSAVRSAFATAASGTLQVQNAPVQYTAVATLMSMQQIADSFSGQPVLLQRWAISATGAIAGARHAEVQVVSTLERQSRPIYAYAAYAVDNGCAALSFSGGATTNSYDSAAPLHNGIPVLTASDGNVGTNGNITEVGATTAVNGSLSTPRTGVGACTDSNVTAATLSGGAVITQGVVQLSQRIDFPVPPQPSPLPPTTAQGFTQNGGCPAGVSYCVAISNGARITPPSATSTITLGNVTTNGSSEVHLNAGTYIVNSITMNGNSKIVIDSGPVVINVAGVGQTTPLTITGQGLVNTTFRPTDLQFIYGGTGQIKLAGGDNSAALIYAPVASAAISGGADLYGAIVVNKLTETGGAAIHYDTRLKTSAMTAGNHTLSAFSWTTY